MQKILGLLILFMVFTPSPAYANAGVPMLILIWPVFWLALVPIILIESWVLCKFFKKESFKQLLWPTSVANFCSTLIGIPFTWGILLAVELFTPGGQGTYPNLPVFWQLFLSVTLQAPWLIPDESQLYWMIPVASMVLLIPFFFMSAWSEGFILAKFLKESHPIDMVKKAMCRANIASYAFLYLIVFIWLACGLIQHSISKGGASP